MGAAGLRNTRITIQTKTVTRTASGDETVSWATLATVWARRRDPRGTELYAANALVTNTDVIFDIVYIPGVTSESRVLCDGETFEVTRPPVRLGAKRRELELHVTRGVRDAR